MAGTYLICQAVVQSASTNAYRGNFILASDTLVLTRQPHIYHVRIARAAPSSARISEIFQLLQAGDAASFYGKYVSDNVHWTVMGTHMLSGVYLSKAEFLGKSAGRIGAVIDGPLKLRILKVIGGEPDVWAVIEMIADAKLINGKPYNNMYSWTTRWENGQIVEVRAYLDGLTLNAALQENEKTK